MRRTRLAPSRCTDGNRLTLSVSIDTSLLSRSDSQRSRLRCRRASAVFTYQTAAPAATVTTTSTVPASIVRHWVINLHPRLDEPAHVDAGRGAPWQAKGARFPTDRRGGGPGPPECPLTAPPASPARSPISKRVPARPDADRSGAGAAGALLHLRGAPGPAEWPGRVHSAGKRAAYALYYAPRRFLMAGHVVAALAPAGAVRVTDLGSGTGAAGAAWVCRAGPARR